MSILEGSVRQRHCQELSKQELMDVVETLDVVAEIKVPTQTFIKFLSLNLCSLVDIVLNEKSVPGDILQKIMYILSSNVSEIRYVMTKSDFLIVVILNYVKQNVSKLNAPCVTRFTKILSQLILKSEYDFLGKIPNPCQFISSLFNMSKFFAIEEFLSEFLSSDKLLYRKFLEHGKIGSIITRYIQTNTNNCEIYLNLLYKLADNTKLNSRVFIPIYSRQFIMTLISIGRTSMNMNAAALAFEFLALKLIENRLPQESKEAVIGQLVPLCRYITTKATKKFDCALRCAVDLLISILHTRNGNGSENGDDEEEEEEEGEEYEEFMIEPKPISRPRPAIPPLPKKSVQFMQNCPLSPERKSGPITASIMQSTSVLLGPKLKTPKQNKLVFDNLPQQEANPNFNAVIFSKSCPVFSELYTIEEDTEVYAPITESNLLPPSFSEKFRRLSDTDPVVEASRSMLRAFFENPHCTFLHAAVLNLLTETTVSTELFSVIIISFGFQNVVKNALKKNPNAPYVGYIHEIIRLIQSDGELVDIADDIDQDWESKEELYLMEEELPPLPDPPLPIQVESPKIW